MKANENTESVTVTINKNPIRTMFKKGEIVITNYCGKRRYNIVKNDSCYKHNIWDEEYGNSTQSTVTLRVLSKWFIIRKIQILFYKLKFYYESK